MPGVEVSVVIPVYNEEAAIGAVIREIKQAMSGVPRSYEILVADDASSDATFEKAKAEGIRIVRRAVRGGSGAARRSGIEAALGEIIVMLDGDGSYDPADIPALLAHFPEFDQVNGARRTEEGTLKWLRAPTKWFIRRLACYLTRTNIPDLNTGLKAFKKDIMKKYLWVLPDGFSCVSTMTLAFLCNGYAVKYVPANYRKRIGRSKFHPLKDTLAYLNTVMRMVMYFRPLRIFMPIAFVLLAGAAVKSIASFRSTSTLQESDIILFVTAVLVAVLGLIADLIVTYQNRG